MCQFKISKAGLLETEPNSTAGLGLVKRFGGGLKATYVAGAGGRTRTDMSLTSPDFESGAYTNFATPASRGRHNKVSIARAQLCPSKSNS